MIPSPTFCVCLCVFVVVSQKLGFLSVYFQGKSSQTRNFPNGVPQGSVLSPTLFNLYMHDMPTPQPHTCTNIASYADDITITTTHPDADRACTLQQEYLDFLKAWVDENRLKIAPAKSTTTLLTSDRHQHNFIPNVTLNNIQIPHTSTTKGKGKDSTPHSILKK